jgi:hypothetical protein
MDDIAWWPDLPDPDRKAQLKLSRRNQMKWVVIGVNARGDGVLFDYQYRLLWARRLSPSSGRRERYALNWYPSDDAVEALRPAMLEHLLDLCAFCGGDCLSPCKVTGAAWNVHDYHPDGWFMRHG